MEYQGSLDPFLDSNVEWAKINELGNLIFKQGKFHLIDELLMLICPIINIVYYKNIKWLDDRYYAREDLIQDSLLEVYKDMKYRWDKYIKIENYPKYFETIVRNVMINLVHVHHNFYKEKAEFNPELDYTLGRSNNDFALTEMQILKEELPKNILKMTRKIANCRVKYAKILNKMIDEIYIENNPSCANLKSKLRVLGISKELFEFLREHVLYIHRFAYNYYRASVGGKSKMLIRMDDILKRYESPTYKILANNYADSIIPEIYAELGPDLAKRFVKVFSGRTIKVPDYRDFCDDLMSSTVYALARGDKENLYQLSTDHQIPYRSLSRIFDKAHKNIGGVD